MAIRIPTVPNKVWTEWKLLQRTGDVKAMVDAGYASEPTIRKALNDQRASIDLQVKITGYFASRKREMKEAEESQLQQLAA
jgi:hypothetical protein